MWPRKDRSDEEAPNSHQALAFSRRHLHIIKAREPKVDKVAGDMLAIKRQNHFAEGLTSIIFGSDHKKS